MKLRSDLACTPGQPATSFHHNAFLRLISSSNPIRRQLSSVLFHQDVNLSSA
jgi:hypothetical protein